MYSVRYCCCCWRGKMMCERSTRASWLRICTYSWLRFVTWTITVNNLKCNEILIDFKYANCNNVWKLFITNCVYISFAHYFIVCALPARPSNPHSVTRESSLHHLIASRQLFSIPHYHIIILNHKNNGQFLFYLSGVWLKYLTNIIKCLWMMVFAFNVFFFTHLAHSWAFSFHSRTL